MKSVMKVGDTCPQCKRRKLCLTTRDVEFSHRHKRIQIKNQSIFLCTLCGYEALPKADSESIDELLAKLRGSE